MPSTVQSLFAAAALERDGVVRWAERVPTSAPGVYVVALTEKPGACVRGFGNAPLSTLAVETLLDRRPELTLDRRRPTAEALAARIAAFWLPDEVVLYVGLAGSSLQGRVGQYYSTKLGARSPHAGGWFLKMLAVLDDLYVHYAACQDPDAAEDLMLGAFSAAVSAAACRGLPDSDRPIPFANLEWPKRRHKRHGIAGAKEPRRHKVGPVSATGRPRPGYTARGARPVDGVPLRTQRITAADIARGQIRIPRGATKGIFPNEAAEVDVELREERLHSHWDPRYGPDRERSGVLRVGKQRLAGLVMADEILLVSRHDDVIRLT